MCRHALILVLAITVPWVPGRALSAETDSGGTVAETELRAATGPPATTAATPAADLTSPCEAAKNLDPAWIDRVQQGVYARICGATAWFDGLFGNPRYDQDSDRTYGRLGTYAFYDRRDGFDPKLRLRARFALPTLSERLRVTLNREPEQDAIEDRPAGAENPLPPSFRDVDDEAWLLGLGYSRQGGFEDGFDFGVGIRLRTPLDPYVKATYRHNFVLADNLAVRFRETPFWRDSRGLGATTQLAFDYLPVDYWLLRWNLEGTVAEDTEGLQWGTSWAAYRDLHERSAISYTALLRGETGADVAIQNYGFETRYRRQVFRRWLFLDVSASLTWPRETLEERRKTNPGVGIGFEMYFGPVPDLEMR